ncbi:hypothetical protein IIA15_06750 [candidate division TA06 bacterium]|nr:hypothetical protein [candidate division TA06 bacterium]
MNKYEPCPGDRPGISQISTRFGWYLVVAIFLFSSFIPSLSEGFTFSLTTSKPDYLRYELVEISVGLGGIWGTEIEVKGRVTYEGKVVEGVGGEARIGFHYDPEKNVYTGFWPLPWNPRPGIYIVEVTVKIPDYQGVLVNRSSFEIRGRKAYEFPQGFSVMTIETLMDLTHLPIMDPMGGRSDWRNFTRWADFLGAQGIFYSVGWTIEGEVSPEAPWFETNLKIYPRLAEETHRAGLMFGAWIGGYLLWGSWPNSLGYKHTWRYKEGRLFRDHHISLLDEKRLQDIVQLVRRLDEDARVDFIGIDYIRPGRGGLEMAEEFVDSMQIEVPPQWKRLNRYEKMRWLGEQVKAVDSASQTSNSSPIRQKWEWWLAHKSSTVLSEILRKANPHKPIFIFLLGWDKGHDHGQDPIMFHDAGADLIAVMLYESDLPRWKAILDLWSKYLRGDEGLNLLVGEMVDASLIGKDEDYPAPAIFTQRLTGALQGISNTQVRGLFWHDLTRGNWGRIEPHSKEEWLIAGATALSKMNQNLTTRIILNDGKVKVIVENRGRKSIQKGTVRPLTILDSKVQFPDSIFQLPVIPPRGMGIVEFPFRFTQESIQTSYTPIFQSIEQMTAFEIKTETDRIVDFCYLPLQGMENSKFEIRKDELWRRNSAHRTFKTRSIYGGGDCLIVSMENGEMARGLSERLHFLDYEYYQMNPKRITLTILKRYKTLILLDTSSKDLKSVICNTRSSHSLLVQYLQEGGKVLLHDKNPDPIGLKGEKVGKGRILTANLKEGIGFLEDYLNWLIHG